MRSPREKAAFAGTGLLLIFIMGVLPRLLEISYNAGFAQPGTVTGAAAGAVAKPVMHLATPAPMKALYMTACVASSPNWRNQLKSVIETTELNAVVIDIKDSTGTVSFSTGDPADNGGRGCVVTDMQDFIATLHGDGIYVIGRISVFQDPAYTQSHPELAVKSKATGGVWKDHKGLSFVDVGAKPYWDRVVGLAKAAYGIGFDELNFDYIR